MSRRFSVLPGAASLVLLAACGDAATAPAAVVPADAAAVPYVIVLRDTVTPAADAAARIARELPSLRSTATITAPGISARVIELEPEIEVLSSLHAAVVQATAADAERLRGNADVLAIEPVRAMTMAAATPLATSSWALDRIDQVALPLDGRTTRFGADGAGVRIAIFDTGIRWTHADLRGRVVGGFDAFTMTTKASGDAQGHGTFVASLAAGTTSGTAPKASLLDVRVLNAQGSGTNIELARGVDWVIAEKKRVPGPMVANMSLGFRGGSTVVDVLVDRLRAAGIAVVVAAGNEQADACGTSPARAPGALTIGATARGTVDLRAAFSNGGRCVDLSAPGDAVVGAGAASDAAGVRGSGTSMASPFVAGAAAVYLGVNKSATPDAVANWIIAESTTDKVQGLLPGTPNRLLTLRRLPGTVATAPAPAPAPPVTPAVTPPSTPAPAATLSLSVSCVARVCTLEAGVPASATAADAPTLVYVWTFGSVATISGTNLRRQIVQFGGATTIPVQVSARKGTTTLGSASTTIKVP